MIGGRQGRLRVHLGRAGCHSNGRNRPALSGRYAGDRRMQRIAPNPTYAPGPPGRLWRPPMAEVVRSRAVLADLLVLVPLGRTDYNL